MKNSSYFRESTVPRLLLFPLKSFETSSSISFHKISTSAYTKSFLESNYKKIGDVLSHMQSISERQLPILEARKSVTQEFLRRQKNRDTRVLGM